MDANKDHFYLEIHTPREFGDSRLYVISFSDEFIAQATFHSLTNLFGELFTRMKEEDFRRARSNNLTETRHAVVHYFAAALHGLGDMTTKWDRGLRNKEYWGSLLDDPVFPESLDLAHWCLSQARLILENGRFLVNEIDSRSITRKPFNILQVITDCHRVLRIEARRKSLRMFQKVRGTAPAVTNGDEILMRIAIMNLIDNAIKYSLNGSSVRWDLIYKPDRYEFRISSSGDAIPQERFSHLLQIGVRGRQRDHLNLRAGTGLGLPVAYRILKAHSSRAELGLVSEKHSDEFGGSTNTFFFEMPYLTGLSGGAAA
jgi:signal transduction histidine kinase